MRLHRVLLCALLSACAHHPTPPAVDLVELSLAEAGAQMSAGKLSARQLTEASLARISALDKAGPRLNAVISINPRALQEADALDAERAAGRVRGPLHGVPVLIKDNIDVAGLVTSAGSLALAQHVAAADAPLVGRLREAGAVILGKTNLSEWANFRSMHALSGWSSLGGQTKNPYALDRNPCGSSSGTGTAIAASLAILGVGTETDGSIACPAAVNGLVGLKPTVGQVPQQGIVPISASQDTAGPMARSVADAAALYAVLAGVTPVALNPDALQGARIGVSRQAFALSPEEGAVFERALDALRAGGAELVDPVEIPTWGQWDAPELEVLLFEFKDGLNRYLQGTDAPVRSLEELIQWNTAHRDEAMPWFGQDLLEEAQARGPLSDPTYVSARDQAQRLAGEQGLFTALREHQLDAIVAPATGPAWMIDPVNGDHFLGAGWGAAAVAGSPSLTVPMGEVHGLPVAMVWMGLPGTEPELLSLGAAFEGLTHARQPPRYRPTVGLSEDR